MRDYEADFSRKQAVAATAVSDNVVKVPAGDIGKGRPVVLEIIANGYSGSGSIAFEVQTDDNADMATMQRIDSLDVSNTELLKGGVVKVATIPTGAKQYLRLNYVVTGTVGSGTITAGLKFHGDTASM